MNKAELINENNIIWEPKAQNSSTSLIFTVMTRNRPTSLLKEKNAFSHGNIMSTKNMPRNPVIVEIGTGEWIAIEEVYNYLEPLKPKTYGIDIYSPNIQNPKTIFIKQDLLHWLHLPEAADRIYSRYTMQYVPNAFEIIQQAYAQTKINGIWMFHMWPIMLNGEGKEIMPMSGELVNTIVSKNKSCNMRVFRTHSNSESDIPGQFFTYEKKDENTSIRLPENIVANSWNMYNPRYENSEKFINFTLGENTLFEA